MPRTDPVTSPSQIASGQALVAVRGLSRRLGAHQALRDISFTVEAGEILGIIGRSGAGKSTLIRCLSGLEGADAGSVAIEGTDITKLPEVALQKVRQRIGMVFQHFNLLSAKTAAENVALPLLIAGWSSRARARRVAELLDLVGLTGHAGHYPSQLSGGQKQRVGIARALAASPALLLCDEATSALDPETTTSILALLGDINRRLGVTIVLITHEMSVIRTLARHVIVLDQGRVVEEGAVGDIFAAPRSDIAKSLLRGFRPELPGHIAACLRPRPEPGDSAVIRIELARADARSTLLPDITESFGVRPSLLHGGIEDVQGTAVGTLFVTVPAIAPASVAEIIAFIACRAQAAETLGYVANPS